MVANKLLVEQANVSARHMEDLTQDMHDLTQDMHEIAVKTKQETVSMRIITLVTLFFLPGTFISVSSQHSTSGHD
jgi:Mg2+ and Co2+ transporter CorA